VQAAALYIDDKLAQKQPVIGLQPGAEKVHLLAFIPLFVCLSVCLFVFL
jgi:hypothetical protein